MRCFVSRPGSSEGDIGRGEQGRRGERDMMPMLNIVFSYCKLYLSLLGADFYRKRKSKSLKFCFVVQTGKLGRHYFANPSIGSLLILILIIAIRRPIGLQDYLTRYSCRKYCALWAEVVTCMPGPLCVLPVTEG
jgi:hypothetical protein